MVLYLRNSHNLRSYYGLIAKDCSDPDKHAWLLFCDLSGNWVDHLWLVRFMYDDSYHMDIGISLCEFSYDDLTSYP